MNAKAASAKTAAGRGPQRKGRKKDVAAAVFYDCAACDERFYSSASLHKHQQLVHKQRTAKEPRTPAVQSKGQYFDPEDPDDVRFFRSIHQKIADNLLHHVDGKLPAHPKKRSLVPDPDRPSPRTDLSLYNFAAPATRPAAIDHSSQTGSLVRSDCEVTTSTSMGSQNSKNCSLNYVCSVCGEKFACRSEFSGHAENNHPNVSYSYFLVEEENAVPSQLLCWRHNSPQGLLGQCDVVSYPPGPAPRLSCTKCGHCFHSAGLLHHHVLQCARTPHDSDSSSSRTRSGKRRSLQLSSPADTNSHTNKRKKHPGTQREDSLPHNHGRDSNNNADGPKMETNSLSCEICEQTFPLPQSLTNHVLSCPMRQHLSPGITEKPIPAEGSTRSQLAVGTSKPLPAAVSTSHAWRRSRDASKGEGADGRGGSISGITSDEFDAEDEGGHVCSDCGKRFAYAANFKKHRDKKCCVSAKMPQVTASVCQQSGNDVSEESSRASETTGGDETEVEVDGEAGDGRVSGSLAAHSAKTDGSQERPGHTFYAFKGSPIQHHTCPHCKRGFTYLANYTKHVKQICPIRQQIDAKKRLMLGGCYSTADSENSALNSNDSPLDHPCNVCHKTYYSLVELMKHRLSHKLFNDSSNSDAVTENCTDQEKVLNDGSHTTTDAVSRARISSSSARSGLRHSSPDRLHPPLATMDKEISGSIGRTSGGGMKRGSGERVRELRSAVRNKQ